MCTIQEIATITSFKKDENMTTDITITKKTRHFAAPHTFVDGVEGKICSTCGEWHPLTSYSINKHSPDGLCYPCKDCVRAYQKEYNSKKRNNKASTNPITEEVIVPEDPINVLCGILDKFDSSPVRDYPAIRSEIENWGLEIISNKAKEEDEGKGKITINEEEYEVLCAEKEALQSENERLKREIRDTVKDLNHLSTEDVQTVLHSSSCIPRDLVRRLYEHNENYKIFCFDPTSGQTFEIMRSTVAV